MAGIENPQSGKVAGTAIAAVAAVADSSKLSDDSIKIVAQSVENITTGITENDETATLCFQELANQKWDDKSERFVESNLINFCNTYLTNANNCENSHIEYTTQLLGAIKSGDTAKQKELEKNAPKACKNSNSQQHQKIQSNGSEI